MKTKIITLICAGIILVSALTSCTPKASEDASEVSGDVSTTRTISTKLGDVEVPANPQRVIVQYFMGDVIALGVEPIGISEVYDGAAYQDKITSNMNVLGHWNDTDLEEMMLLEPDLIITIVEDQYEIFSKIAPTILIPYEGMSTEERVELLGQALNKEKEAKEIIDNYYTNIGASKKKLQEAGFNDLTISVLEGGLDNMTVKGDQFGTGYVVYNALDLKAPESIQKNIIDKDSSAESLSFEVLPEYCGDFIVRNTYEGMDDLTKNEIWNSLPAIKNNRLIEMEFGLSYYSDIYSTNAQINFMTNALLETVE